MRKKQGSKNGALWTAMFNLSPNAKRWTVNFLTILVYRYCLISVVKGGFIQCFIDSSYSIVFQFKKRICEIQNITSWVQRWRTEWSEHVSRMADDRLVVVSVMTGLLFTSERSHYFRKSYLEERGLTSTKSYADRLTKIRPKFP